MAIKTQKSNASYEQYVKQNLAVIHDNLTIKTYKRGGTVFEVFDRKRDYRISIQWKKNPIYEWVIDKGFWNQRNTNKADRIYMRCHADPIIDLIRTAVDEAKKNPKRVLK